MPTQPRKYDRYRIPASFRNGGFPSEKVYHFRTASGEEFHHLGFTSYLFDQDGKRLRDKDFPKDEQRDGYCEVIFLELVNDHTALVQPPQVHGCENSGPVAVSKNDLTTIQRSEWNDYDKYGV